MSDATSTLPQQHESRRRLAGGKLTILLTEGASTSARQALYALGPHHTIDVLDPARLNQCRFSRLVRRWHRCPPFTADPCGYLTCLGRQLRAERYDVLFPPHDEVFLLSRVRDALGARVALAVPEFSAVSRLNGKTSFLALMEELNLPCPETTVLTDPAALEGWTDFPRYMKLDTGTAGQGVRLVRDREELRAAVQTFERQGSWSDGAPVLLQRPARGRQSAVRAVFRHGELVGIHMSALTVRGVGGAPVARESCRHPIVVEHISRLGRHLAWHGALFAEYFFDEATHTPYYIEADPRIGDSANATLSGVNVCQQWIDVALGREVAPLVEYEPGLRSHAGYLILMSQALAGATRRQLAGEMGRAWRGTGIYENSREEISRVGQDWLSALPYAWIAGRLLARPAAAQRIVGNTVAGYALTAEAARRIRDLPQETLVACLDA